MHPWQLPDAELDRADRAILQATRPRRYAAGFSSSGAEADATASVVGSSADVDVADDDELECDGCARDESPRLERETPDLDVDPRLALALYARQLEFDATWPVARAAACRALAARHAAAAGARMYERENGPTLLCRLVKVDGLPDASAMDAAVGRKREIRVDLRCAPFDDGASISSVRSAAADVDRSSCSWARGGGEGLEDWLEVACAAGARLHARLVDVGAMGAATGRNVRRPSRRRLSRYRRHGMSSTRPRRRRGVSPGIFAVLRDAGRPDLPERLASIAVAQARTRRCLAPRRSPSPTARRSGRARARVPKT